jgi:polyisoprenoid-binding protein YceI
MVTRFSLGRWLALAAAVAAPAVHASPLVIDKAHSAVTISVKATIGSFVATLPDFEAALAVDPETARATAAVFRFSFASIKTGNATRDRDMNEWQQTDRFPQVVFTLTAMEPAAGGKAEARGLLRFHGMERAVAFPLSIRLDGQNAFLDGQATIDTREFGLPVIRKFALLKVDPIVRLRFHLEGAITGR